MQDDIFFGFVYQTAKSGRSDLVTLDLMSIYAYTRLPNPALYLRLFQSHQVKA